MPGWVEAHRDAIASTGMAAVGVAFLAQAFAAESWPLWFAGLVCMFLAARDPARSVWRHSLLPSTPIRAAGVESRVPNTASPRRVPGSDMGAAGPAPQVAADPSRAPGTTTTGGER